MRSVLSQVDVAADSFAIYDNMIMLWLDRIQSEYINGSWVGCKLLY